MDNKNSNKQMFLATIDDVKKSTNTVEDNISG
jgi:hypothetical protein